jgi:hypothetical protein
MFETPTRGDMPIAINIFGSTSGSRWRSGSTT